MQIHSDYELSKKLIEEDKVNITIFINSVGVGIILNTFLKQTNIGFKCVAIVRNKNCFCRKKSNCQADKIAKKESKCRTKKCFHKKIHFYF